MIDTGCTNHMTGEREMLVEFIDSLKASSNICFVDNSKGKVSRDIHDHLWDQEAPCSFGRGTSRCTKSRPARGSMAESTQAIYPGLGRREA